MEKLRVRKLGGAGGGLPPVWYRFRGRLFLPIVVFLLLCHSGESEAWFVFPAGTALFLAGFAARVWAQVHLRYRLDVHRVLTTTGPYAYVRNPAYIGSTLILLGLCVASELLWFLPAMLAWCVIVFGGAVRYEEAHLLRKHGEPYRRYLARVPRWRPRFRRPEGAGAPGVGPFLLPSLLVESSGLLAFVLLAAKEVLSAG